MMQTIIQLLSGALGSIGFGLLFHLNRRYLPAAGVGGLLAWLAYLLAAPAVHGTFLANLVGGVCAALYAEFMARWYNAPSTPFFITAAVPLIPGSTLYYCMNAVVSSNLLAAEHYGEQTFLAAFGIAGGMAIAWCLADLSRKLNALLSMLQFRMETDTEENNAEKFSAYSLQTLGTDEGGAAKSESVLLYGVEPDSRYVQLPGDGVYLSSAYADKYELGAEDTITLREKYEDTTYTFTVDGVYDYMGALAVFMPREKLNEVFDLGDGYYGGYFSDVPLTEIKDEYVGSVIDLDQLTKVSRQLMVSMGASMGLVNGFAVMIFFVVVYLLSKMIIEKNAQSISMTKILGYNGSEIARLYLLSTTVVVVLCLVISLPIEVYVMKFLFRAVMIESMTGWIEMWVSPTLYPRMLAAGLATYAVVAVLEYRRIIRVPMDEALKNVE